MNAPLPFSTSPTDESPLRLVIVGHVDHGKSTLVGRLFNDTGSLPEGKLEELQGVCERRGVPFEWAFLMDAFKAERDQNITIDTSQIWFRTAKRPYVIIDAPGHKEFLKNMVTGAASAHAALLLIAADEGVQEQSRRHAYLLSLLGVRQVFVVVNKMDAVGYSQARFDEIEREYRAYLVELGVEPLGFLPISAREGDNIATASDAMPWYAGGSVLETLDGFEKPKAVEDAPLRLAVQDVYRFDERRIIAGRIESGALAVGDELVFSPSGKRSTVASLERWSGAAGEAAAAGESVGVTLSEQIFVERGDVASAGAPPLVTDTLRARVFWMGGRVQRGDRLKIKLATQEAHVVVDVIERVIDGATLQEHQSLSFDKDAVVDLVLRAERPLAVDLHADIEATGRFVLVDGYDLSGGGVVLEALERSATRARVSAAERRARNGHHGALILLRGGTDAARRALAEALERELWSRGVQVGLVEGDADLSHVRLEQARALAAAGVVALVGGGQARGAGALRSEDAGWVNVDASAASVEDVLESAFPYIVGRQPGFFVEVN